MHDLVKLSIKFTLTPPVMEAVALKDENMIVNVGKYFFIFNVRIG